MFDHLKPLQRAFLAAYTVRPRVKYAAKVAGISRESHYAWLANDEAYAKAFTQAERVAGDIAEDEAKRRGIEGILEPVIHRGELVQIALRDERGNPVLNADGKPKLVPLMRRKVSDGLLKLLLTGLKPERYGKKLELAGEVTVNLAERLAAGRARVAAGSSPHAADSPAGRTDRTDAKKNEPEADSPQ